MRIVWLAMLGIHPWDGVIPMPPELWALPEALPIHPSRYYPHTRMIYLALSTLRSDGRARASSEPPHAAGSSTTLMHRSCLPRNIAYARGASLSGTRCVTTKLGSIRPAWM